MKRFRYRFEPLRAAKKHKEELCQRALGEAIVRLQLQQEAIDRIDTQRMELLELQRTASVGQLTAARQLMTSRYHLRLKQMRIGAVELARQYESQVEQRRAELLAATRERKIQDKLKEKLQDAWRAENERIERIDLDEIAIQQFRQKAGESAT